MTSHYSWYDPTTVKTDEQKWLNRYFKFIEGQPAKCTLHGITRCQACTAQAFRHLGDE